MAGTKPGHDAGRQFRVCGSSAPARGDWLCRARMRSARLPEAGTSADRATSPCTVTGVAAATARSRAVSAARMASIGRVRAFERRGEPRDFGRDVVDALAQQRVLDPLVGPGLFGLALHVGEVAGDAVAVFLGALELGLELRVLGLELLGGRRRAAVELGDGGAQIGFGLVRGVRSGRGSGAARIRFRSAGATARSGGSPGPGRGGRGFRLRWSARPAPARVRRRGGRDFRPCRALPSVPASPP